MTRHPPDRDPILRASLALEASEQQAQLARMAGEQPPAAGPVFEHVGANIQRSPRGALCCRPLPFPDSTVLDAADANVRVIIESWPLSEGRRHAPRSPAAIAALERLIAEQLPRRGILTIPSPPLRTWTVQTLGTITHAILAHLPVAAPESVRVARVNLAHRGYSEIQVESSEHPFTATIRIRPDAIAKSGINEKEFRTTLQALDEVCRREAERAAQPTPPARKRPTADFRHPEERPDIDDMLDDLASDEAVKFGRVFGEFGFSWARWVASDAEAKIYNSWVTLQCLKHGLRSPGQLSSEAYRERFWESEGQ